MLDSPPTKNSATELISLAKKTAAKKTLKKVPVKRKSSKRTAGKKSGVKKSTFPWWRLSVALLVLAGMLLIYLDAQVRYGLNERQWQKPARVFARSLSLTPEQPLTAAEFRYELQLLGYRHSSGDWRRPGHFWQQGDRFKVSIRGMADTPMAIPPRRIQLDLSRGLVQQLADSGGRALTEVRMEPLQIGSIYPRHREDRLLVQLNEVPAILPEILLLIEDRHFYGHWGLSPRAIARAMLANLQAGRTVQGGSTITQQLVKNVFLNRSRNLLRKGLEAVMSLLVEVHYSKQEILESYINEIYLGQEGPRSIHGFALASQHYFNRPLSELDASQIALLVGMVKGPSYYDPWRHPQRATERRNVVLAVMAQQQMLTPQQLRRMQQAPLGLAKDSAMAVVYPAYLDLVRRQLQRDYSDQDLQTQGLHIYTAFDPQLQRHAEQSLAQQAKAFDKKIEGAVVVSHVHSGDVVAIVGGRRMRFAGFNRALDARRPVGSLIKPAVYLAALEQPARYTLATAISDGPVQVRGANETLWQPQNFDRKSHGDVLLHKALAKSYNQATARLGMELGLTEVVDMIERLGVRRKIPKVPALLLGSLELAPFDVAQMYQTIASGGIGRPLRAIINVVDDDGKLLAHYPSKPRRVVEASTVHLLHYSMMEVMREGTGRSAYRLLADDFAVAGKTGTSNDLRDSWFAGFAGDYLAVVWLGRDDNKPAELTGASGALKVWRQLFFRASHRALDISPPPGVAYHWIDSKTGLLSRGVCEGARKMPFLQGSAPTGHADCDTTLPSVWQWFQKLF